MTAPPSADDPFARSDRTFTVGSNAGLTARLRILISGLALSKVTRRRFRMLWPLTPQCAASFNDLFVNAWNVETLPEDQASAVTRLPRFTPGELPVLLTSDELHLARRHMPWKEFPEDSPLLPACRTLMNELLPVNRVTEKVDRFRETRCRPEMIGVHMRRGDYVALRPDRTNNTDKAIEATDAFLEQHPDAGILLCTDEEPSRHSGDGEVRGRFTARYGARLVQTAPTTYDRSDPAAIEDALVDLWLLRSTTAFVGSDYSGFSELAVFGRDVPNRMVGDGSKAWKRLGWLCRFGLFNRLIRHLGRQEFGADRPLPTLIEHYSRKWIG